jgi:hypothetical protein
MNKLAFIVLVFYLLHFAPITNISIAECEKEQNVQIVENPKEPLFLQGYSTSMTLEEDLSLRLSEETGIREVSFLGVDSEENIYVLDRAQAKLILFSRNGAEIRSFSKEQDSVNWPDEPRNFFITKKAEIIINDFIKRSLVFYSKEGSFLRSLPVGNLYVLDMDVNSEGNIIARVLPMDSGTYHSELAIFDCRMNLLESLTYLEMPNLQEFNPFRPVSSWQLGKNDTIYYSFPENYEIKIFDAKGKLIKKITKEYDSVEITEEEKQKAKEKPVPAAVNYKFSLYHPAFQSFTVDEKGKIFVQTWEKSENPEGYYYDVFNPEGKFFARILIKSRPRVWKRQKLYVVENDNNGFLCIKRYKVRWNSVNQK